MVDVQGSTGALAPADDHRKAARVAARVSGFTVLLEELTAGRRARIAAADGAQQQQSA